MAGQYIGVSGVARKVKQMYEGVSGVARKVKDGWVGVSGVARKFISAQLFTITLSGSGNLPHSYVVINGTNYFGNKTLQLEEGTIITCYAKSDGYNEYLQMLGSVQITWRTTGKKEVVATTGFSNHGGKTVSYNYVVTGTARISFSIDNNYEYGVKAGTVTIVES